MKPALILIPTVAIVLFVVVFSAIHWPINNGLFLHHAPMLTENAIHRQQAALVDTHAGHSFSATRLMH